MVGAEEAAGDGVFEMAAGRGKLSSSVRNSISSQLRQRPQAAPGSAGGSPAACSKPAALPHSISASPRTCVAPGIPGGRSGRAAGEPPALPGTGLQSRAKLTLRQARCSRSSISDERAVRTVVAFRGASRLTQLGTHHLSATIGVVARGMRDIVVVPRYPVCVHRQQRMFTIALLMILGVMLGAFLASWRRGRRDGSDVDLAVPAQLRSQSQGVASRRARTPRRACGRSPRRNRWERDARCSSFLSPRRGFAEGSHLGGVSRKPAWPRIWRRPAWVALPTLRVPLRRALDGNVNAVRLADRWRRRSPARLPWQGM